MNNNRLLLKVAPYIQVAIQICHNDYPVYQNDMHTLSRKLASWWHCNPILAPINRNFTVMTTREIVKYRFLVQRTLRAPGASEHFDFRDEWA